MRITDIPLENRPRERLERLGAGALSDGELLAIIFKTGNVGENAVDMSNRLIARYGLGKLASRPLEELKQLASKLC